MFEEHHLLLTDLWEQLLGDGGALMLRGLSLTDSQIFLFVWNRQAGH